MKSLALIGFAATILSTFVKADPARLDTQSESRLTTLRHSPASAGELIYRGTVVEQGSPAAPPLFTYERRVGSTVDGLVAAHITRSASGAVVIVEEAHVGADYALQRFEAINQQLGYHGSVVVSDHGRRLDCRLVKGGKLSVASERVTQPVVSGPSLHGFILRHWDALAQGARIGLRFVVVAEKTSYGCGLPLRDVASREASLTQRPHRPRTTRRACGAARRCRHRR